MNVTITPDSNTDGTLVIEGTVYGPSTSTITVPVTMNGNKTGYASWSWKNVQWQVYASGPGAPYGPGATQQGFAKKGATIGLWGTPLSVGKFNNWTYSNSPVADPNSQNTTSTLTGEGNNIFTANFSYITYIITATYDMDGKCSYTYKDVYGTTHTFDSDGTPGGIVYPDICGSLISVSAGVVTQTSTYC